PPRCWLWPPAPGGYACTTSATRSTRSGSGRPCGRTHERAAGMSCPVSTPGSGGRWLVLVEEGLESAVGCRVVGKVVLPAAPDDVCPGAGEDAHGVGVVTAAGDGLGVQVVGPGVGAAGAAGEVAHGVTQRLVSAAAEGNGFDLARLPGRGRDPGQAGQRVA